MAPETQGLQDAIDAIPAIACIIDARGANRKFVQECLTSVEAQPFVRHVVVADSPISLPEGSVCELLVWQEPKAKADALSLIRYVCSALGLAGVDYYCLVSGNDLLAAETHGILSKYLAMHGPAFATSNEDRYDGERFFALYSKDLARRLNPSLTLLEFFRGFLVAAHSALQTVGYDQIEKNSVLVIPCALCHRRVFLNQGRDSGIKPIAFYLPQFHEFPENDKWWGKGFTEWTNTRAGTPMFDGHYQPHEPGELGYYHLLHDRDIMHRQADMAKEHGIYGFCYYYYWFSGKKLMERPLEKMLSDPSVDLPFCICWANETWSRRWDGQDSQILMKQEHNAKTDKEFIEDVIPIFKDPRYIKMDGKPVLIVYRADLFPNLLQTIKDWKKRCAEEGMDLCVGMIQTFGQYDPTPYGCDFAVEFPPHNISAANITDDVPGKREDFVGEIYDYRSLVQQSMEKTDIHYPMFRGCMLGWDNTARRKNKAHIYCHSTPFEFQRWLAAACEFTSHVWEKERRFVFINAWNEWAEGTHLEPDQKYGTEFLQVVSNAVSCNYD